MQNRKKQIVEEGNYNQNVIVEVIHRHSLKNPCCSHVEDKIKTKTKNKKIETKTKPKHKVNQSYLDIFKSSLKSTANTYSLGENKTKTKAKTTE